MNERYQSKAMDGRPCSGIFTAFSQNPLSASPVSYHFGLESLGRTELIHCQPSHRRMNSHNQPARGSVNSFCTSGGSCTTSPLLVITAAIFVSFFLSESEFLFPTSTPLIYRIQWPNGRGICPYFDRDT